MSEYAKGVEVEPTKLEQKLQELRRRREAREISETDFNTNKLRWLVAEDQPLTRADLGSLEREGNAALVLTPEEFQGIGLFDVILASGERMTLDPDDFPADDILIVYPQELGFLGPV